MKNSLVDGDGFNLYQGVLGQGGYLERSTGGAIGRKVLCIHFVHGTKVGNIAQQNSGFDYITQAQTAGFQYCLDILQRLFAKAPVAGSMGSWPETKVMEPVPEMAWL